MVDFVVVPSRPFDSASALRAAIARRLKVDHERIHVETPFPRGFAVCIERPTEDELHRARSVMRQHAPSHIEWDILPRYPGHERRAVALENMLARRARAGERP